MFDPKHVTKCVCIHFMTSIDQPCLLTHFTGFLEDQDVFVHGRLDGEQRAPCFFRVNPGTTGWTKCQMWTVEGLHGFDLGDQNRSTAVAFQRTMTIFKIVDCDQSFVKLVLGYPQDPSDNPISTNSSTCMIFRLKMVFPIARLPKMVFSPSSVFFFHVGRRAKLSQSRGSDCY